MVFSTSLVPPARLCLSNGYPGARRAFMCIRRLRWIVAALISAMTLTGSPLAAEPVALPGLNAAIGDSSISGISSGAFMAVQFGTAWSSVIRGVGVVAGGPYWCAEADMDDALFGFSLPLMAAKGPCGTPGPPSAMSDFFAKAETKSASGDIDPLQGLSRQKIYVFHGYNDAVGARSVTDAAVDFS